MMYLFWLYGRHICRELLYAVWSNVLSGVWLRSPDACPCMRCQGAKAHIYSSSIAVLLNAVLLVWYDPEVARGEAALPCRLAVPCVAVLRPTGPALRAFHIVPLWRSVTQHDSSKLLAFEFGAQGRSLCTSQVGPQQAARTG